MSKLIQNRGLGLFNNFANDAIMEATSPTFPELENFWYYEGYWYIAYRAYDDRTATVGGVDRKIVIKKTSDWLNFELVASTYTTSYNSANKFAMCISNGVIHIISVTGNPRFLHLRYDLSTSAWLSEISGIVYSTSYTANLYCFSINAAPNGNIGIAFRQKSSSGASYTQLCYNEFNGTSWGTAELIGNEPIRDYTQSITLQQFLFFSASNEPLIAFIDNSTATSSKTSIARKTSGVWNIYNSNAAELLYAAIDLNSNIYFYSPTNAASYIYNYSNNTFSSQARINQIAFNANNDKLTSTFYENTTTLTAEQKDRNGSIQYIKNQSSLISYMGTFTTVNAALGLTRPVVYAKLYNRQILEDFWHFIFRSDGSIFMEKIVC